MKALRCDFCNGNLVMDRSREFATCEFCGTKYTKETVQDKIQEIRGTVKIEGAVEAVTGEAEKERLLKNADTYINLKEFDKAIEVYKQVSLQFPDDYRGWWGIFKTPIEQYFFSGNFNSNDIQSLINAKKLCTNLYPIETYFDSIISRYGNNTLHTKNNSNEAFFSFLPTATAPPVLDDFTCWLIYDLAYNKKYLPINFQNFINNITILFEKELYNGNIYYSSNYKKPPFSLNNLYYDLESVNQKELLRCYKRNYCLSATKGLYSNKTPFFVLSWNKKSIIFTKAKYIYGSWLVVTDNLGKNTSILFPKVITKESLYKTLQRCQHCGGLLKHRICIKCGKPKDY